MKEAVFYELQRFVKVANNENVGHNEGKEAHQVHEEHKERISVHKDFLIKVPTTNGPMPSSLVQQYGGVKLIACHMAMLSFAIYVFRRFSDLFWIHDFLEFDTQSCLR